ncbi:MAG: hypothetical protein V4510_02635 [bacterium]
MDSPGPTPDPTPPATPTAPAAPAAPATPPATPPAADAAPAPRPGLFGPRGPMTPELRERQIRGRLKTFGFVFIILGAFLVAQLVMGYAGYERAVEDNYPAVKGGDLVVHVQPADAGWTIVLHNYGNQTSFISRPTDANGTVKFPKIEHAVATLSATRGNVTVQGAVYVPPGETHTLELSTTTVSQKWLEGTPHMPATLLGFLGFIGLLLVIGVVGGVALVRQKGARMALVGSMCVAASGVVLLLFGLSLYSIVLIAIGVWATMTVRKNATAFAA